MSVRRRFIIGVLVLDVIVVAGGYSASVWVRGTPILTYLQNPERRTQTDGLFRADAALGYAPVPGASGAFIFPGNITVPIRFDADGFRVPATGTTGFSGRPAILTLGCSYAFGDAVPAERTFTALIAARLGDGAINAAVSGYGLGQMILRAEQLVPAFRPRTLLVEYAPWLVDRALSETAPSAFGDIPTPYLSQAGGRWSLRPPVFQTEVFSEPFFAFSDRSGSSPPGRWSFFASVALPYFFRTDMHRVGSFARRTLGRLPAPATDRAGAIREAYGRMAEVARANGASMVVVALGAGPSPAPSEVLSVFSTLPGTRVVDAGMYLGRMLARAGEATAEAYQARYAMWAGSPPRLVDPHPNELANKLIADAIAEALGNQTP